ncbi:hypothetical protein LCGC14_1264300 [marine sediment metagenome]|uniref:RNA polymerase alpha subunit C-terminal domain-containing protein n=1 Tax=marine sediment metagenome TaxID=412755 RepID=A0A0F9KZX7_9ZZZZ
MYKTRLDRYLTDIFKRFSIPTRNQEILIDRISKHKTYSELACKYKLSRTRIEQIIMKFWCRLWISSSAFSKYYHDKDKLVNELKKIKLYNPERIRDVVENHCSRFITEYNFSIRADNCFRTTGIRTIGQLVQKTEKDLFKIRYLGKKSILDIKCILSEHGYSLNKE